MQVTPLNHNHVSAQANIQDRALDGTIQTGAISDSEELYSENYQDPSRVEKIIDTLTQELSDREKNDRAIALYKTLNPDYLSSDTPMHESAVVRERIEQEKLQFNNEDNQFEDSEVQNNDAVNNANQNELNVFINDFYTLYNSGYTPLDLTI